MFYLVSTVCAIGMVVFFWVPFIKVLPDLIQSDGSVVPALAVAAIVAVLVVKIVTEDSKM